MARPFFAVAAGLLCALWGWRQAAGLRRQADDLQRWGQILEHLSLLLEEAVLPIPAALRCAADGASMPDSLLIQVADALEADPIASLPDTFERLCPEGAERETLLRLSARIARGSAESRHLACVQASQAIALLGQQSRQRADRDAKLFSTLGWAGGAAMVLMLL